MSALAERMRWMAPAHGIWVPKCEGHQAFTSKTKSGTDGVRTTNRGLHVLELRWGRATRLVICPDTTRLVETLDRLFRAGVTEAHAGSIVG